MMRISREQVERTIRSSSRTFKSVIVKYFGREEKITYTDLDKVNWNNVQKASVEFDETLVIYNPKIGEYVSSTKRKVK